MSIKQNGGVFGRNPTFNDVTIEGDLIINGEVFTGLDFQGSWNASTNTPSLASSVGTNGEFYIVSVAGTTDLNGITNWGIGDWAIFNGTVWQRVEGGADGNFNDLTANSLLVNGTATMDGLTVQTVQGDVKVLSSSSTLDFNRAGTNYIRASSATGSFSFITGTGGFTNVRQTIGPTGDIGFRNDAGIEKFFWDASAESLGIGTSSPSAPLVVNATSSSEGIRVQRDGVYSQYLSINESNGSQHAIYGYGNKPLDIGSTEAVDIRLRTSNVIRMTVDSSGSVGIGTSSPALAGGGTGLHINATSYPELKFTNSTTGSGAGDGSLLQSSGANFSIQNREVGSLIFSTSNAEKMRIDSSGNVIIPAGVTLGTAAGVYSAANTLDDYETGTWIPNLRFGGTDTGITYYARSGKYTKVGNVVHVTCNFYMSSKASNTGNADLTGLPFTSSSDAAQGGAAIGLWQSMTFADFPSIYPNASEARLSFHETTDGGVLTVLNDTNFTGAARCSFSLTYITA